MPRHPNKDRTVHHRSDRTQTAATAAVLPERENELHRVNRALRTLSSCNQTLIHATDEPALLAEICRVMVHEGGYRLVWVGYAENDARKTVRPMASAGYEAGYLEKAGITWADEPRGQGPVGTAIRTGRPALCRDVLTDPAFAPWREDACKRGYASLIVLPLQTKETVIGALSIYAAEPDAFDTQEESLLKELADDLSFGIEALRARRARAQADEALRLSEKSLREAQRVARMGTWDLDLEHNVLRWSDEIYRIFEIDSQKFGASYEAFLNAIHPDDRQLVNDAYTNSLRDRVPYDIVHRLLMKDGRIKQVNERCETFYDPAGRPLRSLGTVQDITERVQAEEALKRAGAYNRSLIEASLDPLVTIGPDGKITDVNRATETVTGRSRGELIGTDFSEYFTEPERARAGYQQVFRDGLVRDYPLELRHSDGHCTSVLYNASVYRDNGGNVIGVFAAARDITERKQAEAAVRQSEERFRNLTENTSDWIWEIDERGVYTYASPRIRDLLGYAPEQVLGRSPFELMPATEVARVEPVFAARVAARAPIVALENINLHRDGHPVVLETSAVPIFDAEGVWRGYRGIDRDITERQRAEGVQARLAAIVDSASDAIISKDLDGIILTWNPAAERLFGYRAEEVIGRPVDLIVPEDRKPEEAEIIARIRRGELLQHYESVRLRKDGKAIAVALTISPIFDARGRVIAASKIVRDVTERQKAQQALLEAGAYNRSLIEASLDPLVTIGPDGKITDVNSATETATGRSRSELIGTDFSEYFTEPERARVGYQQVFRDGLVRDYPLELRHRDGRCTAVLYNASVYRDGRGQVSGVLAAARDITERKKAEEELLWRNVLLSTVQEASIDGIMVVDESARIISCNQRFTEMWRIPAQLVAGKAAESILQHVTTQLVDQPSFLARVRHLYEHREETSRDELTLTDGRVIDRYSAPMLGPQGKYYGRVWYFRDITDRKKLEAQFIQAQKLEAVGQLAGGVAHDFNNILGVILMQLNLLQMESGLSGTVVSGLAELERHAMRGAGLTRQLLMFSRRRVMELRVFDLNGLLEDVSKMLRRLLGEDIAFELKKAAAPLLIEADAGMVEQVAMNLCINARDAMHHGGRLTVEIRRDERPPPAGGTAGSYACLAVTDTGCGMDEATKARIFEPFFTTKPVGKGTGLGLATVYGIVQQHHGWVEVDTAPNCGSTFRVFFPCREQHATEEEDAALRAAPGGDESILLVEDEAALRTSMTACLQHAGYKVVAAANGVEALGKWEEGRHEFHLLLTDHVMPERLTGMELATLLSRAKAGLKVIIMSGYTPGAKETNAPWPAGFTRLAKPFEVRKLLQIVRHCLDAK